MPKRILQGVIVSDKADKTVSVLVSRRIKHPLYRKTMTRTKKYAAHDAENQYKEGQEVRIVECVPLSKSKKWTVLEAVA